MKLGVAILRIEHVAAILIALLAGAAVLFFSGDTDPLIAVESGLGAGLVTYLAAYFRSRWLGNRQH
jgi:hypothetical protein